MTPKQKTTFLAALRLTGNVTTAAQSVRLSRVTMYEHRATDGDFAAAWDAAIDEACDRLEAEMWRRAVVGVDEPVIGRVGKDQDGVLTDAAGNPIVIKKYSDTLMALLIKAHKPEKYRERSDINHRGSVTVKAYVGISPDDWDEAAPSDT